MAKGNFSNCLAVTLPHEGGWSDHKSDPGGATMKGVTLAVFRKYRPGATKADLRAISDADVQRIYSVGYWNPVRGDDLPAGVDLATFDFGVNSGVSRASRYLQAVVGAKQDGVIGPATVAAVNSRRAADVVRGICARRLSFVQGLKTFATFGRGWSRRIADIEARGVKMSGASVLALDEAARSAAAKAKTQNGAAVNSTLVTAGGAGGALEFGDVNWLIVAGVAVVAGALIALVKSRSNINADRAAAYAAVVTEG